MKGVEPVKIDNPFPCLFTCTQPKVFLSAYNDKMADSGLMGRFVVFVGDNLPRLNARAMKSPPPTDLVEGLKLARSSTASLFKAVSGPIATIEIKASNEVEEYYYDRVEEIEDRVQKVKDTLEGSLAARTMEKANKFALIHAWSLNPADPEMTKESIDWGIEIAQYSNRSLMKMMSSRVVNVQDEHVKFVYDAVMRAGTQGIVVSKLVAATHRIERSRRDSILADLTDCGKIVCVTKKSESGKGRPSQKYIATCNMEQLT